MGEQEYAHDLVTEVRGLAPGFLVSFARPRGPKVTASGSVNRTRFHINHPGLADATPDLLAFACELSAVDGRTVGEIIEAVVEDRTADPERLRRFAEVLLSAGYLVLDPPPPRWPDEPVLGDESAAPVAETQLLHVPEGSSFLIDGRHFVWCDHGGTLRLRLGVPEMIAIRPFGGPRTVGQAWKALTRDGQPELMTRASFDDLVRRLHSCGLLRAVDAREERTSYSPAAKNARQLVLEGVLDSVADFEQTVMSRPGFRAAVVPVNDDHNMVPLSLGLLLAYAQELDGGRLKDRYDFVPLFLAEEHTFLEWTQRPAIFLFSNYIWNVDRNIKTSALLKAANPANLTIHGGPSTPKYSGDCEAFFAENWHVDITVRGEGEATFAAVLDALDHADLSDLSKLHDVAGLSYRGPSGVVHTEDRERIAELDVIPSPYLIGLFEPFGRAQVGAVIESNRGCPYGCTFCDWGSATLSRIRMFGLDRVKAELEWCSKNELLFLGLSDANFGILERDVEVAQHIAKLKREYGYPQTAALNYAKNTMKHLHRIVDVFAGAGLVVEPTVAVQTMDETTLKIVRRSNIKLEKYDELANEFRRAGLALATDVMMGLPGATVAGFKSDLQKCTDRDVRARCHHTVLLPNSPMNEPSYREEHGIVARPHEVLKQTKTYTRDDFEEMNRLRIAFYVFDNFGVLRHIARFVRSEVGVKEVDFYERISSDAVANPLRWPIISAEVKMMAGNMAPPSSWGLFVEEVGRYIVTALGVEAGTALDTALQVQLAHLPAPSRTMPQTVCVAHDYVAWHDALLKIRADDHRDDWEHFVPRLHTYPPGVINISDPSDICGTRVGKPMMVTAWNILGWDMTSPVTRSNDLSLTTA